MVQHNTTTTLETSLYSQTVNTLTLNFPIDLSMIAYIMNITANKTLYSPVKDLVSNIKTYTKGVTTTVIEFNAGYLAQADTLHIQIFEEDNPINFHDITHVTGINGWLATYTSASTLTLSGLPFTIDEATCAIASILIQDVNYVSRKLEQGRNGISFYSLNDVIYVLKYGVAYNCFVNTDKKYRVAIMAHKQTVDASSDSEKVMVQNTLNNVNGIDTIANETTVTATANYYPSDTGMSIDGFKGISLTGELYDADGIVSIQVEVSNAPAPTNGQSYWIPIYMSDVKNNLLVNILTSVTTTSLTYALLVEIFNFKWFRVKITYNTTSVATTCFMRKIY